MMDGGTAGDRAAGQGGRRVGVRGEVSTSAVGGGQSLGMHLRPCPTSRDQSYRLNSLLTFRHGPKPIRRIGDKGCTANQWKCKRHGAFGLLAVQHR